MIVFASGLVGHMVVLTNACQALCKTEKLQHDCEIEEIIGNF